MLCNICRTMGLWQVLKSQFLCHLIICYVFLVSGLIINMLQVCTLPLWLLNKQVARRINIRLGYCISSRKSVLPRPGPMIADTHEYVCPKDSWITGLCMLLLWQSWWLFWSGGLELNARSTQTRKATSFMERRTPLSFLTTGLSWISCADGPSVRGSEFLG